MASPPRSWQSAGLMDLTTDEVLEDERHLESLSSESSLSSIGAEAVVSRETEHGALSVTTVAAAAAAAAATRGEATSALQRGAPWLASPVRGGLAALQHDAVEHGAHGVDHGWAEELNADIAEADRHRELDYKIPDLAGERARHRQMLAAWICPVIARFEGHTLHTTALTLRLLDQILDSARILKGQLQCLVCVCYWIAAKLNEPPEFVPTIGTLVSMCGSAHERQDFVLMERHVCAILDWRLTPVTVMDFVDRWSPFVVHDDDTVPGAVVGAEMLDALHERVFTLACYVLGRVMPMAQFTQTLPSTFAAMLFFCARRVQRLTPRWPTALETLTGYSLKDLEEEPLCDELWQHFETMLPTEIEAAASPPDVR